MKTELRSTLSFFPGIKRPEKTQAPDILEVYPDLKRLKEEGRLPRHIAIILDGNGRWAQEHGLPVEEGHRAGARATKELMKMCTNLGSDISLWILSQDNIAKRSDQEIRNIYQIFEENLGELVEQAQLIGGRILHIGDLDGLPGHVRLKLKNAQRKTRKNTGPTVSLAMNYSEKSQLVSLAEQANRDPKGVDYTDDRRIERMMYGKGVVRPADLIIRTGKVQRLSGFGRPFLGEESELSFPQVFLPDFTPDLFHDILVNDYVYRIRTLGGRPTEKPQEVQLSRNGHSSAH